MCCLCLAVLSAYNLFLLCAQKPQHAEKYKQFLSSGFCLIYNHTTILTTHTLTSSKMCTRFTQQWAVNWEFRHSLITVICCNHWQLYSHWMAILNRIVGLWIFGGHSGVGRFTRLPINSKCTQCSKDGGILVTFNSRSHTALQWAVPVKCQ